MIETPFDIEESVFGGFDKARLIVPIGTAELYRAAEGWRNFLVIDERGIDPDNSGDVDFGNDELINDETNLNGNVIGNIYFNIADDAGSYSSAEGCINVVKPTADEQVQQLEGLDIFGEEFRNQFTGIVFKVEAGRGTVKVKAETKGNIVLKVKIGNGAPVEMELDGKLKVSFPYDVSEPTYVYIYAGQASAGVKARRGAVADEPGELKIYGIEWGADEDEIESLTPDPSPKGEGSHPTATRYIVTSRVQTDCYSIFHHNWVAYVDFYNESNRLDAISGFWNRIRLSSRERYPRILTLPYQMVLLSIMAA